MNVPMVVMAQALDYLDAHADAVSCERVCRGWRDALLGVGGGAPTRAAHARARAGRADTRRAARARPPCDYWARAAMRVLCDRGSGIITMVPLAVGLLHGTAPPAAALAGAEPWHRWLAAVYAAPEHLVLRRLLPCLGAWLKCCALRSGPLAGVGAPRVGDANQPLSVRTALRVTALRAAYELMRYEAPYCRALAAFAAHFIACAVRPYPGARPNGAGRRRALWRVLYVGNAAGANTHASEFRSYVRRLLQPMGAAVTLLVNGSLVPPHRPRHWLDAFVMCGGGPPPPHRPVVHLYAAANAESLPDVLLRDAVPLDVLLTDGATLPDDAHAVLVAPHTLVRSTHVRL